MVILMAGLGEDGHYYPLLHQPDRLLENGLVLPETLNPHVALAKSRHDAQKPQ